MANVDGDITLRVDVTPGDVKSAARDIQQEFQDIFSKGTSWSFGGGKLDNMPVAFENTKASAASLYSEMEKVLLQMDKLEAKMSASGTTAAQMKSYQTQYEKLTVTLNNVTNRASLVRDKLYDISASAVDASSTILPATSRFDMFWRTISTGAKAVAQQLSPALKGLIGTLKTVGTTIGKTFVTGVRAATTAIGGFIKSLATANKHSGRNNGLLETGFKKFIRYGLGVRSVFALLNKMRRALGEGLGNLAQYSPEFNSVMSQFVSALETVKNAFATAFAPILSVVIPILDTLMTALINVITLIGKFFAALTGKGTFVQAKRVNKDYAASLNKTAKSAGGASKGIDSAKESAEELKKTIAGFDDVEILHEDKPSSSGGSGGSGGGGGGGVGDLLPSDMFETVAIDSPIANMANRIRELIANQDWTGLGTFLGEQINIVFARAKQLISWDNLGDRITFIVTAITQTFNALVDSINWDLIGSTFAEGLNTLIETAYLLISNIDWGNFGKKLVEGLNAFIRDTNWQRLGETLFEAIDGAIKFAGNGLANINWAGIGQAILDFLIGINWSKLFTDLIYAVSGILGSIIGGLYDLIVEPLKESGNNIVGGILEGIVEAIKNIPQWIVDNIFTPFMDGFNSVFEMHSPSEVMKERGRYIIEGVLEGIKEAIGNIGTWIRDNIFNPFVQGFESAFQIKGGSNSKTMSKEGSSLIQGLQEGVGERWTAVKTFFSKGASGISDTFKNTDWKGAGSNITENLKNGASGVWSTVTSFFSVKTTEIRNQFTRYDWKPGGNSIISGIKLGAQSAWSTVKGYFDTVINELKYKFTNAGWTDAGKSITTSIKNGLDNGYWSVISSAGDIVTGIKDKFNNTSWYSLGSNICSGIKNGIDGGWSIVVGTAKELAGTIVSSMSSRLQINSPSKVMRDIIGRSIPEGIAVGIEAESGTALKAVRNLSNSIASQDIPQLEIPAVALGEVIPFELGKNLDTLNETVQTLLDVIKYSQSNALTKEDITAILNEVLPTMLQQYVSFYIGDEQIARHANAGNFRLDYRFNPIGR